MNDAIAIIGMSARLPGAKDYDAFWASLCEGRCSVSEVPRERWDYKAFSRRWFGEVNDQCRYGAFLDDVDLFDPLFFNIAPTEAVFIDPQQRLLLQEAWNCFEDAELPPSRFKGTNLGVFVGSCNNDYKEIVDRSGVDVPGHYLLGTGPFSLSNRLSYFFQVHGPSFTIDTACSSGLVALHQAVRSLRLGECEAALVGAVNLLLAEERYLSFVRMNMLSPTGRCSTFSANADGYVRGEGVVALLLKPLERAREDGDRIHAIIRGSAVNHDGPSKNITTPNVYAQARVITAAIRDAGVEGRSISYFEAHGTGTPVGDPIEILGINRALERLGEPRRDRTGIGSVKTNIGHLEACAGLAGVVKTVLALQHKSLPGLAHFGGLNPRIRLDRTPFQIVESLTDWPSDDGPRRAGVSSFGIGGANAHVILEEASPEAPAVNAADCAGPALFCFSGRTRAAVERRLKRLLAEPPATEEEFYGIARLALEGREHLAQRVAILAEDASALRERVERALQLESSENGVWWGKAQAARASGEQPPETPSAEQLAELWVRGAADADRLIGPRVPRRRSFRLPRYEFDARRYWVAAGEKTVANALPVPSSGTPAARSDFEWNAADRTLGCRLSRTAPAVAEHVIFGTALVPGMFSVVAALESAKTLCGTSGPFRIDNWVWQAPLVPREQLDIVVAATKQAEHFSIRVTGTEGNGAPVVHASAQLRAAETIDLPATSESSLPSVGEGRVYEQRDIYAHLARLGYVYGPSFQAVTRLVVSPERVEASFVAPSGVVALDAALQVTCAFEFADGDPEASGFPFSMGSCWFAGSLPLRGTLLVSRKTAYAGAGAFEIWIRDESGALCVHLDQVATRRARKSEQAPKRLQYFSIGKRPLLVAGDALASSIEACAWIGVDGSSPSLAGAGSRAFADSDDGRAEFARSTESFARVVYDLPRPPSDGASIETALIGVWRWTRAFFDYARARERRLQVLIRTRATELSLAQAVASLSRTLAQESDRIAMSVVSVDDRTDASELVAREFGDFRAREVVQWQEGNRYLEVLVPRRTQGRIERNRGPRCVLITGGFGGLGRIFAEHFAVAGSRIVLTSRSPLDDDKQRFLEALRSRGCDAALFQCDGASGLSPDALRRSLGEATKIDFVIHAAGTLRDRLFSKKSEEEMLEVLRAKVAGVLALDEATSAFPIGHFILFSSIASATGNMGQSDYAFANGFLADFARWRNARAEARQDVGFTQVIDWPYWEEGGMRLSESDIASRLRRFGLEPLDRASGSRSFDEIIREGWVRTLVISGDGEATRNWLRERRECGEEQQTTGSSSSHSAQSEPASAAHAAVAANPGLTSDALERGIKELCAQILGIELCDFDIDAEFNEYGLDSVLLLGLLDAIEKKTGRALTANVIIENTSVRALAKYLGVNGYTWEGLPSCQPPSVEAEASATLVTHTNEWGLEEPIAVVGVACRFPKSENVEQFWENLRRGVSLISEVNPERWHLDDAWAPKGHVGKSTYSKWAGLITDVDAFDCDYFGIGRDAAALMDPQQRILLELCQHAIDDAGYSVAELRGRRAGVFIGGGDSWYLNNGYASVPDSDMPLAMVSSIPNMIAGRVADHFDWSGPALVCDTACSSSLVALHLGCRSLRSGESELAIVGGVELLLNSRCHVGFSQAKVLSDSDRSFVFDERANGFVLGEGGGVVLLKTLSRARADGDRILAVVRGSALNNDGKTLGLTTPNVRKQSEVVTEALRLAGVSADSIQYLEAHGTGTLLGDPVEIKGATEVYLEQGAKLGSCAVASVKSNMGHLLRAAGIASFIKMVLALRHEFMPATLNCERPHPRFRFAETPFFPIVEGKPWIANGPRRAAISSFGFGGTNCHVILEEAPRGHREVRTSRALTQFRRVPMKALAAPPRPSREAPRVAPPWQFAFGDDYLRDHTVFGRRVVLGVTYVSLAIEHLRRSAAPADVIELRNVLLKQALVLDGGEEAIATVRAQGDALSVLTRKRAESDVSDGDWTDTASCTIGRDTPERNASLEFLAAARAGERRARSEIYRDDGLIHHGATLRTVDWVSPAAFGNDTKGTVAQLTLVSNYRRGAQDWAAHPALLDGAIVAAVACAELPKDCVYVPFAIKRVLQEGKAPTSSRSYARLVKSTEDVIVFDCYLVDDGGRLWLSLEGITCKRARNAEALLRAGTERSSGSFAVSASRRAESDSPFASEDYLRSVLSALASNAKDVPRDTNFLDLGIESNQLVGLAKTIEQDLAIELYPTLLFEYPTLRGLADYLAKEHAAPLQRFLSRGAAEPQVRTSPEEDASPSVELVRMPHEARSRELDTAGDIAIVGMAGRFGRADSVDEFWKMLVDSDDLIEEVPRDHWDYRPWFAAQGGATPDRTYCKWGSFVREVRAFDAEFFGVPPKEAEYMDPQLRLFLEVTYHALEDAGMTGNVRGSNTGLFVGCCFSDYAQEMDRTQVPVSPYSGVGNAKTMLANRPSFFLDLRGPSLCVDTACSSSLVALHLAIQALRTGECDAAIVGGVNLLLGSWHYRYFSSIEALSPSGRCHSFDKRADGYVPGEAVASIVIKPLEVALRDGDRVHAVIRGSAVSHGGRAASVTAPNVGREREVLQRAWRSAGIAPDSLGYIEAHGTGTPLGDPIEVEALRQAFRDVSVVPESCALGSAKAHLGHTEGAAGIVGVIKAALSVKHGVIPGMPAFRELNPHVRFDGSPLYINRATAPWRTSAGPRRAGVSSFGFGGTYAHAVIEQAPARTEPAAIALPSSGDDRVYPCLLSAHTREALFAFARDLLAQIRAATPTAEPRENTVREVLATLLEVSPTSIDANDDLLDLGWDAHLADLFVIELSRRGRRCNRRDLGRARTVAELERLLFGDRDGSGDVARPRGALTLADLAFTLEVAREHHRFRAGFFAESLDDLRRTLQSFIAGDAGAPVIHDTRGMSPVRSKIAEFESGALDRASAEQALADWLRGAELDRTSVRRGSARVSLPAYPFQRKSYWCVGEEAPAQQGALAKERLDEVHGYEPIELEVSAPKIRQRGEWCVFATPGGWSRPRDARAREVRLETNGCCAFRGLEASERVVPGRLLMVLPEPERGSDLDHIGKLLQFVRSVAKALLASRESCRSLVLCVRKSHPGDFASECLLAATRSLRAFLPETRVNAILDDGCEHERLLELADWLEAEQADCTEWRVSRRSLSRRVLAPITAAQGNTFEAGGLRRGGVYLVVGASGALGRALSTHLIENWDATVLAWGRAAVAPAWSRTLGDRFRYAACDATNGERVAQCLADESLTPEGVFFLPGIFEESDIVHKTPDAMRLVLAPKVAGIEVVDSATASLPLAFFVAYSSVAAWLGDFGQCDYAVANRYLECYMAQREARVRRGQTRGRSLAIAWPMWEGDGLGFGGEAARLYLQSSGLSALRPEAALRVLESALHEDRPTLVVLCGERKSCDLALSRMGLGEHAPRTPEASSSDDTSRLSHAAAPRGSSLASTQAGVMARLRQMLASYVRLDPNDIPANANLGDLGVDSISLKALSVEIAQDFAIPFSPTLFFRFSNLEQLSVHLCAEIEKNAPAVTNNSLVVHESASVQGGTPVLLDGTYRDSDIAIVGMDGTFPGAENLAQYWELLESGSQAFSDSMRARFGDEVDSPNWPAGAALIDGVERFDCGFFRMSPYEAQQVDPQQRLLLECAYHTIEDAGLAPSSLQGRDIGVFVGAQFSDYHDVLEAHAAHSAHAAIGMSNALIANRLSFFFDFHGPSETIDTACSSSLIAIHRASSAIRKGECEMALAGGVSLMLSARTMRRVASLGVLSPTGQCRPFDAEANGYVRGEGYGLLLLKPLAAALRDGNRIRAVLRASAEVHGGHANTITAPNISAQKALLRRVYAESGITAQQLRYIEAHGTGTELGDPVEVAALSEALSEIFPHAHSKLSCEFGSVKGNIGHLEPAAGIAGAIKAVLMLEHRVTPGLAGLTRANPLIQLPSDGRLRLVSSTHRMGSVRGEGSRDAEPAAVGVSSFGFGGALAHAALLEYAPREEVAPRRESERQLFVLSARSEEALDAQVAAYFAFLGTDQARRVSLADVCWTLQVGRDAFEHRLAIVCDSLEELRMLLAEARTSAKVWRGAVHDGVEGDAPQGLEALAAFWVEGGAVDWRALHEHRGRIVALPGYAFQKQTLWPGSHHQDKAERADQPPKIREAAESDDLALLHATSDYLVRTLAELLKWSAKDIAPRRPFQDLGIDSILIQAFNARVEKEIGKLPKTILFEVRDVDSLARYLTRTREAELRQFLRMARSVDATSAQITVSAPRALSPRSSRSAGSTAKTNEEAPIAIVGVHVRVPGANGLEQMWSVLAAGVDCVREIPSSRWDVHELYDADAGRAAQGKIYCKWGGFIDDIYAFDHEMFRISPREAEKLDPQERLMLESAFFALEDAGYSRHSDSLSAVRDQVGVFVGATSFTYALNGVQIDEEGNRVIPNSSPWSIANRISYVFDLGGPSLAVDTACSASLTALHLACQALSRRECQVAVVGGVNLYTHPSKYVDMCQARMLSPTGRCRTFSADADGFVPGEGVVTLVLKPLEAAKRDRDAIYGVILGSAVNHGGATSGYTVPNPGAQASLLATSLERAGVPPETISYVEAHGTGTLLGDPVEIAGITRAFGTGRADAAQVPVRGTRAIGSIKSNVGHLEAAAGLVGVVKVLLQMREQKLAPTLHCAELNSNIDFDACPFAPQRKLADWPRLHSPNGEVPRRASVSSFGAGGGNAHVILEEPPVVEHTESSGNQPQLFPFSATTPARLAECLRVYLSWLGGKDLPSAARVAFSLQTTREMRHERVAFICDDLEELAVAIRAYLDDPRESSRTYVGEKQGASRPLWQADTADFELLVRRWVETGALFKVADYWAKGGELNWEWLWPEGSSPARVRLPATPLMRSTHVLPQLARTCDAAALVPRGGHPLVAPLDANLYRLRYGARFDADDVILRDHVIDGELVVPGVAYLEAALFAAGAATEGNARRLQNITWQRPIILMNGVSNATLELSAAAEGLCITLGNDGLTCLSAEAPFVPADSAHSVDVAVPEVSGSRIAGPEFYRRLATAGMHYGRALQVVESLTCGKGRVVARLRPAVELTGYRIWPDLLDGAFQALAGFLMERDLSPAAYMPFSLEALEVFGEWPHEACTASLELSSAANGNAELVAADLQIISDDGRLLVSLKNLVVRRRAPACDSHVLELLRRFRDDELSFSEATNLLTEFHHVEHS